MLIIAASTWGHNGCFCGDTLYGALLNERKRRYTTGSNWTLGEKRSRNGSKVKEKDVEAEL